jgi:predicted secreted protein
MTRCRVPRYRPGRPVLLLACGLLAIGGLPPARAAGPQPSVPGGPGALSTPAAPAATKLIEKKVAAGGTVTIRLPANPTTGYSWSVDDAGSQGLDLLTLTGQSFETAPQGAERAGAPGEQVFTFMAQRRGQARVVIHYRRPWVPTAIEAVAEVRIAIE